jgi:hypothetical protein
MVTAKELLESPDGAMRDVVMVARARDAANLCTGFIWIAEAPLSTRTGMRKR